ncbi:MAG TPA: hypothetical protein VMN57_12595 [Anaerolineales bacterium]|nr:hypothetical protein [Anaerolineales bacterium]
MMEWVKSRITWGFLLIAGGVLALLVNTGLIADSAWIWAGIFLAAGLYFLFAFLRSADNWWAAFPAFGALGIAATILTTELTTLPDELAGAVFLGLVSLAFFAIYLRRRDNWWALIPAGAILTIAGVVLVSAFESALPGNPVPLVLFGGLGATFLLIAFTRAQGGRNRWAIAPALVLFAIAGATGIAFFDLGGFVLPVILIGTGAVIILRSLRR